MRLENFRKLSSRLFKFILAFNPPIQRDEEGNMYVESAPTGYRWIRKLSFIIQFTFSYLLLLLIAVLIWPKHIVFDFIKNIWWNISSSFDEHWYLGVLKIFAALLFGLLPALISYLLTTALTKFIENYDSLLSRLDHRIKAGVIGFVGFLLLTISFILSLLKAIYS